MARKLKGRWYAVTLKSIGDAVIAADSEGRVTFMNPPAEALMGWNQEDARGKDLTEVFKIIDRDTGTHAANLVTKALTEGAVVSPANHILMAAEGAEITIDGSVAPIRDDRGDITGVVVVFRDITERKRSEVTLKEYSLRLEEMVKERTQELQDAQEELIRKERLAVLGQLAGGVGHELRNPLGAITNAAYFLNMALEDPDPEVKETLEVLQTEVAKSERIITSLLDFARPKPITWRKVDLRQLLQEALMRQAVPESIEVETRFAETLPEIVAGPDHLGMIFENIILNAIQAMPEGGRLVVSAEAVNSEWVVVSFTDTGVGISEQDLKQLFEPLFTTKARGIGLGLAITKRLVEEHGGTIGVRSQVKMGSTVTVRLPVTGAEQSR